MITEKILTIHETDDQYYITAKTRKCKYGQFYKKPIKKEDAVKQFLEFYNQFEKEN